MQRIRKTSRRTAYFRPYLLFQSVLMQRFLPARAASVKQPATLAWLAGLRCLFYQRTRIGFTIGEALLWWCFHISWAVWLGFLFYFTGLFNDPNFISLSGYAKTQVLKLAIRAVLIIPFWWLFFVKLRSFSLAGKAVLHVFTGGIFTALTLYLMFVFRTELSRNGEHTYRTLVNDIYATYFIYFSHFALFHAYNFWLDTKAQMKREKALQELAYQSEINSLKSQIEPHFLFNTLNSISASVPPSLENTRVLIAQLADTFRYALRVSEHQFVTLGDELEFMKTWLALEKQRLGERLHLRYEIDPAALGVLVPPMLLQPLVENALNHGIAEQVEGGTVTIECRVEESSTVYIAVSDTGVGYSGELEEIIAKGVGLSNTAKRLKLLYNQPLQVTRQRQGLLFFFTLPMHPVHEAKSINC